MQVEKTRGWNPPPDAEPGGRAAWLRRGSGVAQARRGSGTAQARHDRAHARSASVPLAYGVGEPRRQWIDESRAQQGDCGSREVGRHQCLDRN